MKPLTYASACLIGLLVTTARLLPAQDNLHQHIVTLPNTIPWVEDHHCRLGSHISPQGDTLSLNNFYLKENSQPVFPIMGEFQYGRYARQDWERELLKMKASGITVIGFYSFWILHEQQEGTYRFDDNLDVRAFLKLIQQHGLQAVARIGPWVHGETRNGGYPDWFVKKYMKGGFDRAFENHVLKPEVVAWYHTLATQFEGLYYKDGGPIIGIQLDNEVRSNGPGHWGYEYLLALKRLAVEAGIDVPLYTVTGWPGNNLPEDEVLPLWGGYPAAPWTGNSKPLAPNKLYTFVTDRLDKSIGSDILGATPSATNAHPLYRHPFLTVEMGGGIQDTYHRRPVIAPEDLMGLIYTRLGAGANMMGYYIYHGSSHPLSEDKTSGTQESKSSLYPYPNDYPIISYDFQAPLSEYGYVQPAYNYFKRVHQFLNAYGAMIARMIPTIPADNPDRPDDFDALRYAIRSDGNSGFLLVNNYVRHQAMPAKPNEVFELQTAKGNIRIPQDGTLTIPADAQFAFPFNLKMEGVTLNYALAHPQTILHTAQEKIYVFYEVKGITPEFNFEANEIASIQVTQGTQNRSNNVLSLKGLTPGKDCLINVQPTQGPAFKILLLTAQEALEAYCFERNGQSAVLFTPHSAYYNTVTETLHLVSEGASSYNFFAYPALTQAHPNVTQTGTSGMFTQYKVDLPKATLPRIDYKDITHKKAYRRLIDSLDHKTPAGPTYGVKPASPNPYVTYRISLPKQLPKGVADVKLAFQYRGNAAALYADRLILADDYYNGKPLMLSLEKYIAASAGDLLLQITPLLSERSIYFDSETPLQFAEKEHAVLKNISSVPVYEVVIP